LRAAVGRLNRDRRFGRKQGWNDWRAARLPLRSLPFLAGDYRQMSAMKIQLSLGAALLLAGSSIVTAQQPVPRMLNRAPAATLQAPVPAAAEFTVPNLSTPNVTPELWLYSQEMRRHDDPAQAVRRRAELRADQRSQRLAALKWFGLSNSRPQASPVPLMGVYSPTWVGNGPNRYDWVGVETAAATVHVESFEVRR
jgi:hypothetical protein